MRGKEIKPSNLFELYRLVVKINKLGEVLELNAKKMLYNVIIIMHGDIHGKDSNLYFFFTIKTAQVLTC